MAGPLKNARHERFAQGIAKGRPASEAYVEAGFSRNDGNSVRLKGNEKVAARVHELMEAGARRAEITVEMVSRELARIGFADLRRLLKWTGNQPRMDESECEEEEEVEITAANFIRLFDSDELDDDTAAAISEISQTKDGAIKVKLHDKQAALVALGRYLGMFKDRVEHTGKDGGPIQTEELSARDVLLSRIAGLAERSRPANGDRKPH